MIEQKFFVGNWVWSTRQHMALEILPEYDSNILASCSIDSVNRWPKIYPRLANGLEVFASLSHRERVDERFKNLFNDLKDGKI